jgi:glucosamine--fructose-6-phosphate aminotransferase (isomerizing)
VNVVGSTIAKESDDVLYTWAGPEIAVAPTKAYSTQLAVIYLLALYIGDLIGSVAKEEYDAILSELLLIPSKVERILEDKENIQYFASIYFNNSSVFFIGRNVDYAIGMEGSLKLKEISYIHSEAYAAGELKHGTISLIESGTLVVALASYDPLFDKLMSNVIEVKARGANVLGLAAESRREEMGETADNTISIPDTHPVLRPSLAVVPLQMFSYYVACSAAATSTSRGIWPVGDRGVTENTDMTDITPIPAGSSGDGVFLEECLCGASIRAARRED